MKHLVPPVLMLLCGLGMTVLDTVWPGYEMHIPALPWVGACLIVVGLSLATMARRQFRRADAQIWTFEAPTTLVSTGLFAISRNPMYLGLIVSLLGWSMALGSASPLLGWLVFVLACALWYVPHEEARMRATFGDAYTAYSRRTRRWV